MDSFTDTLLVNDSSSSPFTTISGDLLLAEDDTIARSEFISIMYIIVGCIGIPGNMLTIIVIVSSKNLRTKPVNCFIINQACIDICTGGVSLLVERFNQVDVVTGDLAQEIYCRLWVSTYPLWTFALASTYNLTFLTIERFLAITRPMTYDPDKVYRRLPFVLVFAWLLGLGLALNCFITYAEDDSCLFIEKYNPAIIGDLIPVYIFVVGVAIPSVIMTYAYIRMGLALRKSRMSTSNSENKIAGESNKIRQAEVNIYQTCLSLMLIFVLCWSNNCISIGLFILGVLPNLGGTYYQTSVLLIVFNSCLNPYVYVFRYREFKKQLKTLFCSCRHQ